ncbi:MAG: hypothetical protein KDD37_02510 [Bdellovibrionales bacterium]|nr:hypothetical protein [Bdellovibrionales bacterium]
MSKFIFMMIFLSPLISFSSSEANDRYLSSAFSNVEIDSRGLIKTRPKEWNIRENFSQEERVLIRRLKKNGDTDFRYYQTAQVLDKTGKPKALFELEGSFDPGFLQQHTLLSGAGTRSLRYFDYDTKNMAICSRNSENNFLFISNKHQCNYFTKDLCRQLSKHDLFGKSNELQNCANNLNKIQNALTTPNENDRNQLNAAIAEAGKKYTTTLNQEVEKEKEYELNGTMNMLKTFHEALSYCESIHDFYKAEQSQNALPSSGNKNTTRRGTAAQ